MQTSDLPIVGQRVKICSYFRSYTGDLPFTVAYSYYTFHLNTIFIILVMGLIITTMTMTMIMIMIMNNDNDNDHNQNNSLKFDDNDMAITMMIVMMMTTTMMITDPSSFPSCRCFPEFCHRYTSSKVEHTVHRTQASLQNGQ